VLLDFLRFHRPTTGFDICALLSPTYTSRMLATNTSVRPRWLYVAEVVLLALLVGELVARSAYFVWYGGKQDRLIRVFMGSEDGYDPNMGLTIPTSVKSSTTNKQLLWNASSLVSARSIGFTLFTLAKSYWT
jgi:hypothetical protein